MRQALKCVPLLRTRCVSVMPHAGNDVHLYSVCLDAVFSCFSCTVILMSDSCLQIEDENLWKPVMCTLCSVF